MGTALENATVLVQGSRILQVGKDIPVPNGAVIKDCTGRTIIPGLVDTHSHIAGPAGGDSSAALHPDVRVLDSLNFRENSVRRALAGGITTANIMPGSGLLMSGQTAYCKLRGLPNAEQNLITDELGNPLGGLKMANGTNPIRRQGSPATRSRSALMVRELFLKAQEYLKKRKEGEKDPAKLPPRDIGMEALCEVLEGRRIVQHHTHRADDILTVLRLQREFGFKVVLHHVSEGHLVAKEIAEAGVPCSIISIDAPGGKLEAVHLSLSNGAVLEKAGVKVAVHTDDGITDSRLFLRSAAMMVRGGMSREAALQALTIRGAEMLGLEKRIGSLEAGKDADLLILSGDPFSVYTKVLETWVEGRRVFDRSNPADLRFAVGGPGSGEAEMHDLCCDEREAKR